LRLDKFSASSVIEYKKSNKIRIGKKKLHKNGTRQLKWITRERVRLKPQCQVRKKIVCIHIGQNNQSDLKLNPFDLVSLKKRKKYRFNSQNGIAQPFPPNKRKILSRIVSLLKLQQKSSETIKN
jgi:hypothetical protein